MENNIEQKSTKSKLQGQGRKFQLTVNNPKKYGLTHEAIIEKITSISSCKYWAMCDERGKNGTLHTHVAVFYDMPKKLSTIASLIPQAHIEMCRGTVTENRAYIRKEGKHAESAGEETNMIETFEEWGEMPDETRPSFRSEQDTMDFIQRCIDKGMTPKEIYAVGGAAVIKHEKTVKKAYYLRRDAETPPEREVAVYYHVGPPGSGKSYQYVQMAETHGEENIYFMTDYANGGVGGFDKYNGERILFMDELKGQMPFPLMLQLLDRYKMDVHARYTNATALWEVVHITSVYPPESLYQKMVEISDRAIDPIGQLLRRIHYVVYHACMGGNYNKYEMPMEEYRREGKYAHLVKSAEQYYADENGGGKVDVSSLEKVTVYEQLELEKIFGDASGPESEDEKGKEGQ